MAVTPIGNTTFVSQNVGLASTQAANEQSKANFAALANLTQFQEKEKSVERIDKPTPSDEVQEEVKEKREEAGSNAGGGGLKGERKEFSPSTEENENTDENGESLHQLDISI